MGEEEKTEPKNYTVKLAGGFIVNVTADNEEYAKGLVVGQITAKVPGFQIMKVTVEEK